MDILKKHASDNYLDRTFVQFAHSLEQGRIGHTAIPGWMLMRSYCVTCDEPVTALRHRGVRYELVASGTEQMGKKWVIHQCKHPQDVGPLLGEYGEPIPPEPEYGEAEDIAEAQQEAKGEVWPDDPDVRDGDGQLRGGGWNE